jgi:hypothetical protein
MTETAIRFWQEGSNASKPNCAKPMLATLGVNLPRSRQLYRGSYKDPRKNAET